MAIVVTSAAYMLISKDKEFMLGKFILDLNKSIFDVTKNTLKIMLLPPQPPAFS